MRWTRLLLIVLCKKFKLKPTETPIKRGKLFVNSFFNGGMILFVLICVTDFVTNYVSEIFP